MMKNTTNNRMMTTGEIAERFNILAQQEKCIEIQDEFFSDNVKSTDPPNSPYFDYAAGKVNVRRKGEEFGKNIKVLHSASTTVPVVASKHFAVGRKVDVTAIGLGRIQIDQIMLY